MKHRMHRHPRKRRHENKTDYDKRLSLLKSGKHRLVVRITNTKVIAQLVAYEPDGDKVITSAYSTELEDYGWDGSFKNISSAYLTGLLIAKKAEEESINEAVLDLGLHPPVKGSRIFAVAKGANDGGLGVPVSEDIAPSDDRLHGEHLEDDVSDKFDEVASDIKGD